jgi:hypothetical protein
MAGHFITFWDNLGISLGVLAFRRDLHIPLKHDTCLSNLVPETKWIENTKK